MWRISEHPSLDLEQEVFPFAHPLARPEFVSSLHAAMEPHLKRASSAALLKLCNEIQLATRVGERYHITLFLPRHVAPAYGPDLILDADDIRAAGKTLTGGMVDFEVHTR